MAEVQLASPVLGKQYTAQSIANTSILFSQYSNNTIIGFPPKDHQLKIKNSEISRTTMGTLLQSS